MADFFLSNLKSTTTASQNSMKFTPCSAVIRKVILPGTANFLSASIFSLCSRCRVNPFQMKFLIETISNPQQSWGDSWTQGAINVVSN